MQAKINGEPAVIGAFNYAAGPELPAPLLEAFEASVPAPDHAANPVPASAPPISDEKRLADLEQRMGEEVRRSFDSGRERGRQDGKEAEQQAQAAARGVQDRQRTEQAARLVETFAQERDRYLHAVEHEVVKLSLAVAARILRREAQMDPLLLTGAVRVALAQLSSSTQVRLRVPPAELDLWTESMALLPHLAVKPQVMGSEGMRLGDCAIDTEMGSVDLGVRAQLAEIEKGFFDRAGSFQEHSGSVTELTAQET